MSAINEIIPIPMDSQELVVKKARKPRVAKQVAVVATTDATTDTTEVKKVRKPRAKKTDIVIETATATEVKKEPKEKKESMKAKKEKKVVEEVEQCPICIENYTPILRKKCVCKYCKADTCSKCIERYLMDSIQDAHCLHCKVNYNDVALREICTMTYIQQTYFKHRQDILINREKANLPGLQDLALEEKKKRDNNAIIKEIESEMIDLEDIRKIKDDEYVGHYTKILTMKTEGEKDTLRPRMKQIMTEIENLRKQIEERRLKVHDIRNPISAGLGVGGKKDDDKDERKKFIRRCTHDGCQGFLSTAWKCGLCEYYSCNKCFKVRGEKHDSPHDCVKEDIETADLIRKDCKSCPKCGEFIMKSEGCSQMFCISCQTPWDWNTGKIVTHGTIHNPHYYEWMRRNGQDANATRNPLDVPCGGYPNGWELRKLNTGIKRELFDTFYEFHRICQEIQDISTRTYRSHLDNTATNSLHVKFLLNDIDEKHWGQLLAHNEKKRKRDQEVQEIFAAFRMVAVELINRIQNHSYEVNGKNSYLIVQTPIKDTEKVLEPWAVEVNELINMINKALQDVSIGYHYIVPNIEKETNTGSWSKNKFYFRLVHNNYYQETKKTRATKKTKKTVDPVIGANTIIVPASEYPSTDDELTPITKYDTIITKEEPKAVAGAGAGAGAGVTGDPEIDAKIERIENLITIARAEGNNNYVEFLQSELNLLM